MSNFSLIPKKPKSLLLLILSILVVVGVAVGGGHYGKMAVVATALLAVLFAEWAFFGSTTKVSIQSAAITGSIVGLLVFPSGSLLVAWSAAVVAIASKKLLVFRGERHIFNPAAFGLVFSILVFGNRLNWWGNSSVIVMIIGAGLLLLRLRRLSLPISYFIARIATTTLFAGLAGFPNTLLLPNLFFAFIMLVEPKTSPSKRTEQWIFGAACGILSTIFYQYLPALEGDLIALLTLNIFRPLIRLQWRLFSKSSDHQQIQKEGTKNQQRAYVINPTVGTSKHLSA